MTEPNVFSSIIRRCSYKKEEVQISVSSSGPTPLLLLPENIRIRRFNLQTEAYHDFLQEEEHIMALDYDWDHNNTGLSRSHID